MVKGQGCKVSNTDTLALNNNLRLNRSKSTEIAFVRPRGKGLTAGPPSMV